MAQVGILQQEYEGLIKQVREGDGPMILHLIRLKLDSLEKDVDSKWNDYAFWKIKYEIHHDKCVDNAYRCGHI